MSLRSPAQASCGPGGRKDTMMLVVLIEEESAGWLPVAARPPPSFCSPPSPPLLLTLHLLLLLNRYCSSSIPVPPGFMKKAPPATAPPPRQDGPQAILCVDVLISRYFTNQIWIMRLIFLATLLVSTLSPWLHPLLASSGTYRNSLLAFFLSLSCD